MKMQRLSIITFYVVVFSSVLLRDVSGFESHDLIIGNRVNGDFLLEQVETDKSSIPLWKTEKSVTVRGNGVAKITSVEIYDLKPQGHSATPTLLKGGPGETFVTVHFESERGHGIHFLVKVYAK